MPDSLLPDVDWQGMGFGSLEDFQRADALSGGQLSSTPSSFSPQQVNTFSTQANVTPGQDWSGMGFGTLGQAQAASGLAGARGWDPNLTVYNPQQLAGLSTAANMPAPPPGAAPAAAAPRELPALTNANFLGLQQGPNGYWVNMLLRQARAPGQPADVSAGYLNQIRSFL
jgi:hypothetical protein